MKTKILILTTFLGLGMVFQGCEKEDETTNNQLSNSKVKNSINKSTPPTGNPISTELEHYGEFHNDALDYIATNPDFPNISDYEVLDISKDYAESVFGVIDSIDWLDSSTIDYDLNPFKSISTTATEAYNSSIISNTAKNYFLTLENKIYDYSNDFDFQGLIDYLNTFENTVYNDNSLTVEDKKLIISTSIMTRYSTTYWTNVHSNTSHPWYNTLVNTEENLLSQEAINSLPPTDGDGSGGSTSLSIPFRMLYDIFKFAEYAVDCPEECGCGAGDACLELSWIGGQVASGKL